MNKHNNNASPMTEDRKAEINQIIEKINYANIFPPKATAHEIMVRNLNKDGLPKRSMNCFFVFRHIIYLELSEQKLIYSVKDGVYLTQLASEIWKKLSKEQLTGYKNLAAELKRLQIEFHKDKTYCKTKPAGSVFVNMNDDSFLKQTSPTGRRIKKVQKQGFKRPIKKKEINLKPQPIYQKNIMISSGIEQNSYDQFSYDNYSSSPFVETGLKFFSKNSIEGGQFMPELPIQFNINDFDYTNSYYQPDINNTFPQYDLFSFNGPIVFLP